MLYNRQSLLRSFVLILFFLTTCAEGATLYISPSGNDANLCTQSSRCQSFNRAFQMARNGDIVLVGAGTYPTQTLLRNSNLTGAASQIPDGNEVTFKPESGRGTVTLQEIFFSSGFADAVVEHVAFEDMLMAGWMAVKRGSDIHFTRMTFRSVFQINCVDYYSIRNSDVGAHNDADGIDLYGNVCPPGAGFPSHGLLEANIIHDITSNDPAAHPDAVALFGNDGGLNGFIMRRNIFYRNACINYRGEVGINQVIENNFFGDTVPWANGVACGVNVQIHGKGTQVRFNTIQGSVQQPGPTEGDGQYWVGNIITGPVGYGMCPIGSGTIAEYNVWNSNNPTSCGGAANGLVSNFSNYFVNSNPNGPDLHLTANATAALNAIPLTVSHPSTDGDGNPRPYGSAIDAGADEYGSGGVVSPTPTPTPMPTPMPTPSPSPAPTPTPTPAPVGSQVIRFDDLSSPGRALTGQYPVGVIDWGTSGSTYLSGPWEALTTNSISYNGSGVTSLSFSILSSNQTLAQLDIYNGGASSASVTIKCGVISKSVSVPSKQMMTVQTGFSSACASVQITCSNGWNTNFDNLVLSTLGAPAPSPTPSPTPAPTPTPTPAPTPAPTAVTVSFNDLSNPGRALTGQYPVSVIDWGTSGNAYLSEPWGQFPTNSLSFNGSSIKSLSFVLMKSLTLNQLDIYNGGSGSTTVTVTCGSTSKSVSVATGQVLVYKPGFTSPCSSVTLKSTNGWGTNFDNLVLK